MKRIRIPGIVDIVSSDDPSEILAIARDQNFDRAYADHSIRTNGTVLQRIQTALQIDGRPLPTVASRCAEGRAEAQDALWKRLNALSPDYSTGPDQLEGLAAFVRGESTEGGCGILAQQTIGRLFSAAFEATAESWNAATVLSQATRALDLALPASQASTQQVDEAKQLLASKVGGDLAAVHAIGIAVHNVADSVNRMRELYKDPSNRTSVSPEAVALRCLFAPARVLRQPIAKESFCGDELETGTLVVLDLQKANSKTPDADLAFLRNTWSQCPAEKWVPAQLEGVWRRACA